MDNPRISSLRNDARELPKDADLEATPPQNNPPEMKLPWVLRHAFNTAGLELFRPSTPEPRVTGVPILFPGWDKLTDGKLHELFPHRPEYNFENPFFTAPDPESIRCSEAPNPPSAKNPNLMFFTPFHPREQFYPHYDWDMLPIGVDTKLWSGLSRFERIEHWLWIQDTMHPAEASVTGFNWLQPPHGVHHYLWSMVNRHTKVALWLHLLNSNTRRLSPAAERRFTMEDCELEVATADRRFTKLSSALPTSADLVGKGYHASAIRLAAEIGFNQMDVDTISPGDGLTTCDLCGNGPPVGYTCLGCVMK